VTRPWTEFQRFWRAIPSSACCCISTSIPDHSQWQHSSAYSALAVDYAQFLSPNCTFSSSTRSWWPASPQYFNLNHSRKEHSSHTSLPSQSISKCQNQGGLPIAGGGIDLVHGVVRNEARMAPQALASTSPNAVLPFRGSFSHDTRRPPWSELSDSETPDTSFIRDLILAYRRRYDSEFYFALFFKVIDHHDIVPKSQLRIQHGLCSDQDILSCISENFHIRVNDIELASTS